MRRKLAWTLAAVGLAAALPVLLAELVLTPRLRAELVTTLARGFGADVRLEGLGWRLGPSVRLSGEGLRIGTPPIVEVSSFVVTASPRELFESPRRLRSVHLDGLLVNIPRRAEKDEPAPAGPGDAPRPGGREGATPAPRRAEDAAARMAAAARPSPLVIEEVTATAARVVIAVRDPDKPPRVYAVERLRVRPVDPDGLMGFEAIVATPRPRGPVETEGRLGPWNRAAPAATPIEGRYRMRGAAMDVFHGIEGTIDAEGTFTGTLGELAVEGTATIPDFRLDAGDVVPLDVRYRVDVGEKGGDIGLRAVEARLGDRTTLFVRGSIVRAKDRRGRRLAFDVTSERGRVEDLVRLALRAETPPLTGAIELDARVAIPPGDAPVLDRLGVEGSFRIREGRFGRLDVQETLARVSRATAASVEGVSGESVVSDLEGAFTLRDAVLRFSRLTFAVPGTRVELAGTYALRTEALELRGRLLLERPPSALAPAAIAGWLRWLDPIVGTDEAGLSLPIAIDGSRRAPRFRPDLERLGEDWRRRLERLFRR